MKFNFLSKSNKLRFINKAATLVEALPYIRQHSGKNIVIKYGGHAMGDKNLSRKFSKDTITNSYKENNGLDINGNSFVHPVGGHIISDMELIRMTDEERDEAFKKEGLGDKFDFDKNCRAMSAYHNNRMGVLRLSSYLNIIDEPDENDDEGEVVSYMQHHLVQGVHLVQVDHLVQGEKECN